MKWYIRKNILGYYIQFPEEIDAEVWEGKIGTTYEDFLLQKWVPLTEEQVQFHLDNPGASIKEVLDMELFPEYEPTEKELLDKAKQTKLWELASYDSSTDVNSFTINDKLRTWFTPEQRANYKNSIDSAKLLGIDKLQLLVENQIIELPTEKANQLLAMIQLYADTCYIVTKQHEATINSLETFEEVEDYDFTVGYPSKLNFEL